MTKVRENPWSLIKQELWQRVKNAICSAKFLAYFFIFIVFLGSIGVWLPHFRDSTVHIFDSQNLFTYYATLVSAVVVESIMFSARKNEDLAALGLVLGSISMTLAVGGYIYCPSGFSGYVLSGTILILLLVFFVTVNDEKYDSKEKGVRASTVGFESTDPENIRDEK